MRKSRQAWVAKDSERAALFVPRCRDRSVHNAMTDLRSVNEADLADAIDFQEDEAVLAFIRDALALHENGGVAARTTLASVAIVLSVWARKYPELERRFRANGSSDWLEPVSDIE